jgi:3-oxoacyl-[acyl-carrier protein] reductase
MTADSKPVALVTNAAGFAGPGAVLGLLAGGFRVYAQDLAFAEGAAWQAFHQGRADLFPVIAADVAAIVGQVMARESSLHAIVSNDHYPAPATPPHSADNHEMRANYHALVEAPFRLIQQALPVLRAQARANIVMVTSNRTRLPLAGAAFPDAARAAANALVRSLAIDCAADGIVVNAIAPNFLYSEAYYPKAIFTGTQEGRDHVSSSVPVGRLADQAEIGEVIRFLATVETRFLTGAVIDFSGGWPFGPPRPAGN